ncbi:MAG: tetratricopeptide repeat protein [Candidatus Kappaea frigidicola]|nr:tetratricopeptide repeat protein [Candidatus Kappaea frigidicola]
MCKPILFIILTVLILFSFTSLAHSDTITLKTGKVISGLITQEEENTITINISIGTAIFSKDKILKIEYDPDYLLDLADEYFKDKDYKRALKTYGEIPISSEDEENSIIKEKIAQCHTELRNKEEKIGKLYQQAEDEYNEIKSLKWHYTNLSKYNKVIKDCNKLIKDYPKTEISLKAQYLIMRCYEEQAEYKKRFKALDKYVDMTARYYDEDRAAAFLKDIADSHFESKEYKEALKHYKYVIKKFPDYSQIDYIHFRIALSYSQNYDYKKSMPAYKRFIKNYPESHYLNEAYEGLSEIYYIVYKPKKALASLQKLLKKAPQKAKPDIYINIAEIYYNMKELDKAKKGFEEIIRLYPNNPLSFVAQKYIRKIQEGNKEN